MDNLQQQYKNDSQISEGSFVVIRAFMISELKLKGAELMTYAIIYGFSIDGKNGFQGGLNFLEKWTISSKQTVITSLQRLMRKKLITKNAQSENQMKYFKYIATNTNSDDDRKGKTNFPRESYDEIMDAFSVSPKIRAALFGFIKFRGMNNNKVTNDELSSIIVQLDNTLGSNESRIIDEIDYTIKCGKSEFFEYFKS